MTETVIMAAGGAFLFLFFLAGAANLKDGISRDPTGDFLVLVVLLCVIIIVVLNLAGR